MPNANFRKLHVGLLWHSIGHDNLGVDALSRTNCALIEAAAEALGYAVEFTTFGGMRRTAPPPLPDNVTVGASPGLRDFATGEWDYFRQIGQCDIVFDIGEGDSFADIYGLKRLGLQIVTKLGALVQGVPLVLSPQTIGPFDNPVGRGIAVAIMNRARAVLARDHLSKAFLDEHVCRAPTDEFIDVAFALPFEPAIRDASRVRVGVNVSGLLFHGGYSGANELGMKLDYVDFSRRLIRQLLDAGATVELFAHVADWQNLSAGAFRADDDQSAMKTLQAEFPDVVSAPIFSSSSAVKGWMSGLDLVIAGRMHACIGAFSAGVPVVPIAYSRKFNGLFESLDYPFFIDGKARGTEDALSQTMAWFGRRQELLDAVRAGKAIADRKLDGYRERIRAVLSDVAGPAGEVPADP